MVHSRMLNRFLSAVLVTGVLVLAPAVHADGDANAGESSSAVETSSLVSQAIEWLLDLVTNAASETNPDEQGDGGQEFDPSG